MRCFALAATVISGAWFLFFGYQVARRIGSLYAMPGAVHWRLVDGDITISGASEYVSYHPVSCLAVGVPLAALVVAYRFLRKQPLRSLRAPAAWTIALPTMIGVAFLLVRPTAAGQVGKSMLRLDELEYHSTRPDLIGRPMLVEFWATWCGPCVANIPHLNDIQEQYQGRGLVVLGVSSEKSPIVEAFLKQHIVSYTVAEDPSGRLQSRLGITGIPHAFLVNRGGKIVWEGHPARLGPTEIATALK